MCKINKISKKADFPLRMKKCLSTLGSLNFKDLCELPAIPPCIVYGSLAVCYDEQIFISKLLNRYVYVNLFCGRY